MKKITLFAAAIAAFGTFMVTSSSSLAHPGLQAAHFEGEDSGDGTERYAEFDDADDDGGDGDDANRATLDDDQGGDSGRSVLEEDDSDGDDGNQLTLDDDQDGGSDQAVLDDDTGDVTIHAPGSSDGVGHPLARARTASTR